MDYIKIQNILAAEPAYRLRQVKEALFKNFIDDWSQATSLPAQLRDKLNQEADLAVKAEVFVNDDQRSVKAQITLEDGLKIETVLLLHPLRKTVCLSSQVGCPLGCSFCATGQTGFKRNLSISEIVEQACFWSRYLKNSFKIPERISNIVFMGMGEPFLNYDNVMGAIRVLNDAQGMNIGIRHFSISTIGLTEGIQRLAGEREQVNLAVSLHAPDERLRTKLMPINQKYPIKDILKAVDDYLAKTRRKVMFEYLLIRGINDSKKHAQALAKLMKKPLYMVNLIVYNPTGLFQAPSTKTIREFKEILDKEGVYVTQRLKMGKGIKGACGQLTGD